MQRFGLLATMMCLSASALALPRPARASVFYEIFVRSFQDSNGDGIGDLNGITSRLGYLADTLHVDGIWLTPIFKSPSYHGYDVTDYREIEPELGSLADFKRLLSEAHRRGLRVMLDLALNHTSIRHPWFSGDSTDPASPFHDFYCWREDAPDWPWGSWFPLGGRYYYSSFAPSMPDLNWKNPLVRAELEDIARYWASLGVDGFRLDAARYYVEGPNGEADTPETHAAIRELAGKIRSEFPRVFFTGEVWADSATIAPYVKSGDELDLAFAFPQSGGLVESLKTESARPFLGALADEARAVGDLSRLAPFLTNHDMTRAPSEVSGSFAKLKLAAAALLTLPGTPFIYYGEEIGMPNGDEAHFAGDLGKRTPMLWSGSANHGFAPPAARAWQAFSTDDPKISVEAQLGASGSLLETYRALIDLRRAQPALADGALRLLPTGNPAVAAFLRGDGPEALAVVLNFSGDEIHDLEIPLGVRRRRRGPLLRIPTLAAYGALVAQPEAMAR